MIRRIGIGFGNLLYAIGLLGIVAYGIYPVLLAFGLVPVYFYYVAIFPVSCFLSVVGAKIALKLTYKNY